MLISAVTLALLYLFQAHIDGLSQQNRESRGSYFVNSWTRQRPSRPVSLIIWNFNREAKESSRYLANQLTSNSSNTLEAVSQKDSDSNEDSIDESEEYDKPDCIPVEDPMTIISKIKVNTLRVTDEQYQCEKKCGSQVMAACDHNCVASTIKALSFSCIRQCHLAPGEKEYLHDVSIHPQEEDLCRRKRAKCCKNNCIRRLWKACLWKRRRVCTKEMIVSLKAGCMGQCEQGSLNPYLNAFCSFGKKIKFNKNATGFLFS